MNIYKYPITFSWSKIDMPQGAKVLTVQMQNGNPCIWALVNPMATVTERIFQMIPTGPGFDDSYTDYIGTIQHGDFVGHVFEITNK